MLGSSSLSSGGEILSSYDFEEKDYGVICGAFEKVLASPRAKDHGLR